MRTSFFALLVLSASTFYGCGTSANKTSSSTGSKAEAAYGNGSSVDFVATALTSGILYAAKSYQGLVVYRSIKFNPDSSFIAEGGDSGDIDVTGTYTLITPTNSIDNSIRVLTVTPDAKFAYAISQTTGTVQTFSANTWTLRLVGGNAQNPALNSFTFDGGGYSVPYGPTVQ